jgi:arginase
MAVDEAMAGDDAMAVQVESRVPGGIVILNAPSNLGLRPPQRGSTPGCAKAPEALREAGLHRAILAGGGTEAGVVLAGRYVDDDGQREAGRLRNEDAIIEHSRRLAERLEQILADGGRPLVVGGDCSILIGAGLALRRRGEYGLVHLDGHSDLRNPFNSDACASLAGEDLAAATGRHWSRIADIDGAGPYFPPGTTVHLGCRDDDEHLQEARATLGRVLPASTIRALGVSQTAAAALRVTAVAREGFWIHLDVDILDPRFLPAVDSPAPDGLDPEQLTRLLSELAPYAVGAQVTVFDPDLDPDGSGARLVSGIVVAGLSSLGSALTV